VRLNFASIVIVVAAVACSAGAVPAHQPPQSSSASSSVAGKIKCQGGDSVNVTADAEQGLPLQLVDKAACGEQVTILSDPLGYTVKIRTASGKIGYVTRYEVLVDPNASPKSTPIIVVGHPNTAQAQAAQPKPLAENNPGSSDKGPHKPRVYISDSDSWNETGGFSNTPITTSAGDAPLYAGYNPELTDVYQSFTSDCAVVTVTQQKSDADYAILFDKGINKKGVTGLGGLVKVNKVTVLSRSGETLFSDSARSADTVMRLACSAIAQKSGTTAAAPTTK